MNTPGKVFYNGLLALSVFGIIALNPSTACAYSCEGEFAAAEALIAEAEALVKDDSDARIFAMIAEAKGIAQAGIISHRKANERHTGVTGKFMHGDSVRNGKWAQSLAKEALFLLTGKIRP